VAAPIRGGTEKNIKIETPGKLLPQNLFMALRFAAV
jgi:hypothetical protein